MRANDIIVIEGLPGLPVRRPRSPLAYRYLRMAVEARRIMDWMGPRVLGDMGNMMRLRKVWDVWVECLSHGLGLGARVDMELYWRIRERAGRMG